MLKVDITEVISANNKLKTEFFNDYNRHIFVVSMLALLKRDISLCETYRMEYIKTKRPMKKRQQAFQQMYTALVSLYYSNKVQAVDALSEAKKLLHNKSSYLPVINHNIDYIGANEFSLNDVEFYLGNELSSCKYYIDIRMLY